MKLKPLLLFILLLFLIVACNDSNPTPTVTVQATSANTPPTSTPPLPPPADIGCNEEISPTYLLGKEVLVVSVVMNEATFQITTTGQSVCMSSPTVIHALHNQVTEGLSQKVSVNDPVGFTGIVTSVYDSQTHTDFISIEDDAVEGPYDQVVNETWQTQARIINQASNGLFRISPINPDSDLSPYVKCRNMGYFEAIVPLPDEVSFCRIEFSNIAAHHLGETTYITDEISIWTFPVLPDEGIAISRSPLTENYLLDGDLAIFVTCAEPTRDQMHQTLYEKERYILIRRLPSGPILKRIRLPEHGYFSISNLVPGSENVLYPACPPGSPNKTNN